MLYPYSDWKGGYDVKNELKSFLLYCTLSREDFESIQPLIWKRNHNILVVTSTLSAAMGGLFYLVNRLTGAAVTLPYLFLMCGSTLIYLLMLLLRKVKRPLRRDRILCYSEMVLVWVYAGFLSVQPSNYAVPATSIIVFIALLPLTIDDRPVLMYAFMLVASAGYLVLSKLYKSPNAFSLDVLNVGTFCVVGMILYSVICIRNTLEIHQGVRVERIQQSVISSLATVVEERDESTGGHITRTVEYVTALLDRMREDEKYASLTDEFRRNVILAAPMHDVGKIKIPDAILNKPAKLTEEEFAVMKGHSAYGAEIIEKTMFDAREESYYTVACNIARFHHERWDGNGYPDGLAGEEIPLEARIMALADVYDALVSERVYKKPFSPEKARAIIKQGSGSQFDPKLTALFLECVKA